MRKWQAIRWLGVQIPSGPFNPKMAKKIDVSKHALVPKHSKISEKEKKALVEKYFLILKELPKILAKDPAIEGIGMKDGDIVKIVRKSPTAGESVFYRRVVKA